MLRIRLKQVGKDEYEGTVYATQGQIRRLVRLIYGNFKGASFKTERLITDPQITYKPIWVLEEAKPKEFGFAVLGPDGSPWLWGRTAITALADLARATGTTVEELEALGYKTVPAHIIVQEES